MSACVLFFIRCSNLTTVLSTFTGQENTQVTAVFEFSVDQLQGKLAVVMDQLNGKLNLPTTAPFTLQSTLKSVHEKRARLFSLSTCAFSVISHFHLLFLSFCHARSFFFSLFYFFSNVVPSSADFHVAGPDKWIRGP